MKILNTIRNVGLAGSAMGVEYASAAGEVGTEVVRNAPGIPFTENPLFYAGLAGAIGVYLLDKALPSSGEEEREGELGRLFREEMKIRSGECRAERIEGWYDDR